MFLKKKRTRLSLIAVILSTAIIFISLTLFHVILSYSYNETTLENGNYHYTIESNNDIHLGSRYAITKEVATGIVEEFQKQKIQLHVLTPIQGELVLPFVLIEGEIPSSHNEIMIPSSFSKALNDSITLNNGTYQIVGIYQDTKHTNNFYIKEDTLGETSYYIKDKQIHLSDSFSSLVDKTNISGNDVINHQEVIISDTLKAYLNEPTLLLTLFVAIICLSIGMSLISIHNVILISDQDRKKEIGLLKSVGAKPKGIVYLIILELSILGIVGTLIGLGIGIVISDVVVKVLIDRLYITYDYKLILQPINLLISFIIGYLLMVISGIKSYYSYFKTDAIEDLKEVDYQYEAPTQKASRVLKEASWQLFVIYNGRMRKQSNNIQYSFMLLLITSVLFSSVALSNIAYKNRYVTETYDFIIRNMTSDEVGFIDMDFDLAYDLYHEKENGSIEIESIRVERLSQLGFFTKTSAYHKEIVNDHRQWYQKDMFIGADKNGVEWCNVFYYPTILDDYQFSKLYDQRVEGNVEEATHILIRNNDYISNSIEANEEIGLYQMQSGTNLDSMMLGTLGAVVDLELGTDIFLPTSSDPLIMDYSRFIVTKGFEKDFLGSETIKIKLKNSSMASDFETVLDNIMIKHNIQDMYQFENIASIQETSQFTTFLFEVLLYPLFMMLFMISLMNMYNVFSGNIHLKRNDLSKMSAIGMKYKQMRTLFFFEYLEGYINAGFIVGLLLLIIAFLENHFAFSSALDLGGNLIATLIMTFFVIAPILVIPLILITMYKVKRIQPMKDLHSRT